MPARPSWRPSPGITVKMLDFCTRHGVEAMDHLREGKARYRIVLENDLG